MVANVSVSHLHVFRTIRILIGSFEVDMISPSSLSNILHTCMNPGFVFQLYRVHHTCNRYTVLASIWWGYMWPEDSCMAIANLAALYRYRELLNRPKKISPLVLQPQRRVSSRYHERRRLRALLLRAPVDVASMATASGECSSDTLKLNV